jgi:hypothetical protein
MASRYVAVSIDGRPPAYWPEPFGSMLRHLADVMAEAPPHDQWEITLRVSKGRVTAMGPTPFRPDRWGTHASGGGANLEQEAV